MLTRISSLFTLLTLGFGLTAQAPSGPPNNPQEYEEQYQWRIRQERLNGVYIPKSLEDALAELDRLTSKESQATFRAMPEDQVYRRLFNSLRLWIVHNWGLNGGSRLGHLFRPLQLRHPDDIAQVIIIAWHRKHNGKDIELKELVERVREDRRSVWEARKEGGK